MKKDKATGTGYESTMPYDSTWKEEAGSLGFRMCNDYMFRALLQKDEEVLKGLISSFLQVAPHEIEDVLIMNPIVIGETIGAKEIHLDTHVELHDGREMDFEMQLNKHKGWNERSLLYLCRGYGGLSHGDDYAVIRGIWQITFCDFCPFPENPAFYSTFLLRNIENIY